MKRLTSFQKKFNFPFIFDKRQRFALQALVLTAGLLITQLIWKDYRFAMVFVLSIASYLLTIWSLAEDIKGIEWILLFILPVFFTASMSLFYFLLPGRWITRVSLAVIFSVGTYAILLVENIYNVAVERSIQLVRAAQSIGLLVTLVVVFFISNIVYSLRLASWQNVILISFFSFILALQSLWSVKLEPKLTKTHFIYTGIVTLCIGQLVFALSFWPIENATFSLLIAASYYSIVGVLQQYFLDRFFANTIREYIFVFIFTFAIAFLTTRWGGG